MKAKSNVGRRVIVWAAILLAPLMSILGWLVSEDRRTPNPTERFSALFQKANVAPEDLFEELEATGAKAEELGEWKGERNDFINRFAASRATSSFMSACPDTTKWFIQRKDGMFVLEIVVSGPTPIVRSAFGLSVYFDMLVLPASQTHILEEEYAYIANKHAIAPGVITGFHTDIR